MHHPARGVLVGGSGGRDDLRRISPRRRIWSERWAIVCLAQGLVTIPSAPRWGRALRLESPAPFRSRRHAASAAGPPARSPAPSTLGARPQPAPRAEEVARRARIARSSAPPRAPPPTATGLAPRNTTGGRPRATGRCTSSERAASRRRCPCSTVQCTAPPSSATPCAGSARCWCRIRRNVRAERKAAR